jgi:hypothetical protein
MTTIASKFAIIHRNRFLRNGLNRFFIVCHFEAPLSGVNFAEVCSAS